MVTEGVMCRLLYRVVTEMMWDEWWCIKSEIINYSISKAYFTICRFNRIPTLLFSTCMSTCKFMYVVLSVFTCMHPHTCIHTRTILTHSLTHTHTHARTRTHTHTHTHSLVYVYTSVHTTVHGKYLQGGNIGKFGEFVAIRQFLPLQIFPAYSNLKWNSKLGILIKCMGKACTYNQLQFHV